MGELPENGLHPARDANVIRGWANRFPWCVSTPRGFLSNREPSEYPKWLRTRHLLVDEHEFGGFMAAVWHLSIDRAMLNLMEYYGWLLPVRKAVSRALWPTLTDYRPGHVEKTFNTGWFHVDRPFPKLRPDVASRWSLESPPRLTRFSPFERSKKWGRVAVTPWFMIMPGRVEIDGAGKVKRHLPRDEPSPCFPPGSLRRRGLWLKVTDKAYWDRLAVRSDFLEGRDPPPFHYDPSFRLPTHTELNLTARQAARGNDDTDRFYLVGGADLAEGSLAHGLAKRGRGQDWALRTFIDRLHAHVPTEVLFDLVRAKQTPRVNLPQAAFEKLRRTGLPNKWPSWWNLPPLHGSFYRDVLLFLSFRSARRRGISPDTLYGQLADRSGLTSQSVRRAISEGGRRLWN